MTNPNPPNPLRPNLDGDRDRAQPGDVLGIESDGEVTELGDTREDEDERRHDADKTVADSKK